MTSFEERLKEAKENAKRMDKPSSPLDFKTNTFQQTVTNDLNKTGNTIAQQQRNQNSAQVAARSGGSLMDKATVETPKQSPFKTAFDVVDRGAGYFNRRVTSTIDFAANVMPRLEGTVFGVDPAATFTGQVLKPVTDATGRLKGWVDETVANIDKRVQNDVKDSKAASIAADLGSLAAAGLPVAVLAYLSGGASLGTQLPAQTSGVFGLVTGVVKNALLNPLTGLSFAQTLGQGYEEAKASGANDVEAMTAATLSSLFNAAIETGGGIETLPGEIRGKDLSTAQKALEWVKSALEEGGEEVVQSVITNMTNKGIFDSDKPLFSTTDENAVVNPGRMLQEFGSGAAVGGILGGGQMLGNAILNAGNRNTQKPTVDSVMPKPQKTQPPVSDITPTVRQEAAKPSPNQKWEKFFAKNSGTPSATAFQNFTANMSEADSAAFIAYLDEQEKAGNLKWRGDGTPVLVMPAEDHIDNRDYVNVGDPKVKSFQYNNPELQPFIQEGLQILADDLDHTLPGERYYNGIDPNGVGSQGLWSGQKRHTSPEIAMLKDDFGMSYEAINKAMDDLAQDAGRENNANAKRLELVIDQILTKGHRSLGGTEFPPNQAYIEAKGKIAGAKPIQQQTETEVEELPMMPGYSNAEDEGIRVYRGYNRSQKGTEKNLASRLTLSDVLGRPTPGTVDVELLPLTYYTEDARDAERYANMDLNFLEDLKARYGADEGARSYKILTGRDHADSGDVKEHRIYPKKVLDLTELGEVTKVSDVYKLLSKETGLPETSLHEDDIDSRLMLSDIGGIDDDPFQTFKLLRNLPVVNGDYGSRFFKFMQDFGYDAVKYRESGTNHYAVVSEKENARPNSGIDLEAAMAREGELYKALFAAEAKSDQEEIERIRSELDRLRDAVSGNQEAKPAMGAADSGFDPISHASIEYGAIPPGENPARVVDVPVSTDGKTRVSQYARTGAEAPASNEEMAQRIMDLVAENKLSHEIFTDDAALEAAGEKIAEAYLSGNGYNVYTQFLQDVAAGKAGKDLMATGSLLYADAAANGDYDSSSELFVALTDLQTRAGQTVQAARLLKKLSPEGRVWVVNKIVGKIQNEVNQGRKPDKQIKIKVDDALIDAFKNAKTPKEQAKAMDNIYKAVAERMPTNLGDAVNGFRYFMMLGNLSTHIKNIGGNLGMSTLVSIKNSLATTGEVIVDSASKAFGGKGIQRTKAFLNLTKESDRSLVGTAWADYENVLDDIAGAGKYKDSARYQVSKYQSYWKLNDPKTKAGELVSKGLQALEKAPQANSKLMNMEDRWFSQPNYAVALAGYMKANNLTEPNDAAREYAVKEAQKATFRDLNAVSKWAKSLGKTKFTKFLVDSVFPFKATPANVGVRAVEYSPAGLAVTLGKAYVAVRKGEFSAAQFIDDLSANATGSLLAGLGYLLAQSGVLRVAGIGDDKEKQQQALEGYKNNSIYNVPIEFISPAAATLLLGGAIYEAKATKELDGRSYGASDSLNALSGITDPILETTMLDGLRGILSAVRSSGGKVDGKLLTDIGIQIVGNYIGSFMSSQLSRVYAATDDATRTTYVDKTKDDTIANLPSVQKLVQGLQYKSHHRADMVQDIDAWGRPIEGNKGSGGNDFENFMESLFNVITPTYPGKVQTTVVDDELKRLYRAEGVDNSDVSLFMKDASKDFEVNGKTVYLTGEQWEQYQTDRGQTAMEVREAIMNSKAYKNLSDTTKAVAMDIALEYATGYAKDQLDVGYKFKLKWMAALVGSSPEKIAKTIIERAVARTED